jgi:hypothetical protein
MKIVEVENNNGLTTMNNTVVAVYKGVARDGILVETSCLGSGFLVYGQDFHFMTAKHVVDTKLEDDEAIYIFYDAQEMASDRAWIWRPIKVNAIELSEKYDIAFGFLGMSQEPSLVAPGLKLATECNRNADIINIEFSAAGSGSLFQSVRKGNIVYIHDWPGDGDLKGVNIMETSFACLKGASGSPVIDIAKNDHAIGIMIQNVDHELAPTQLVRAVNDDGSLIEEVKYMMPQGIAISAYGIQNALVARKSSTISTHQ